MHILSKILQNEVVFENTGGRSSNWLNIEGAKAESDGCVATITNQTVEAQLTGMPSSQAFLLVVNPVDYLLTNCYNTRMGYRTVVILYNDRCGEWSNDPDLGKKIEAGMNYTSGSLRGQNAGMLTPANLHYGNVAQCVHADTTTLSVINGYHMRSMLHSFYKPGEDAISEELRMLKEVADKFGYKLVKKAEPKSN